MITELDPSNTPADILSYLEVGEYDTSSVPVSPNIPLSMNLQEYDHGYIGIQNLINTVFEGYDPKIVHRITKLALHEYYEDPNRLGSIVGSMLDEDGKPKVLKTKNNEEYLSDVIDGAEAIAPEGYVESGRLDPLKPTDKADTKQEIDEDEQDYASAPTTDYETSGISEEPRDHSDDEARTKRTIKATNLVTGALKRVIPERRAVPRREYYVQTESNDIPVQKTANQIELERRALKALGPFEQLMSWVGLTDGPEGEKAYSIILADIEAKKERLAALKGTTDAGEHTVDQNDDLWVFQKLVSQPRKTSTNVEMVDKSDDLELDDISVVSSGSLKASPISRSKVTVSKSSGMKITKQGSTISLRLNNRGDK